MRTCKVEGCNNKHQAKGYCMKHYRQIDRHGRLTPELEEYIGNKGHKCSVENCNKEAYGKGLCMSHWKLSKGYIKSVRTDDKVIKECIIDNCNKEAATKGLCRTHYSHYSYYRKRYNFSLDQYINKMEEN